MAPIASSGLMRRTARALRNLMPTVLVAAILANSIAFVLHRGSVRIPDLGLRPAFTSGIFAKFAHSSIVQDTRLLHSRPAVPVISGSAGSCERRDCLGSNDAEHLWKWRRSMTRCSSPVMRSAQANVDAADSGIKNDRLLRAVRGDQVDQPPVWLFRQAGPYLPEYNQYKVDNNVSFLDIIKDPHHASEVLMQPLRRYNLDAAILFSDILTIPEGMGLELEFAKGKGMRFINPIKEPQDLRRLDTNPDSVTRRLAYVMDCLKASKAKLKSEGYSIPLIGFSAAPWTLFAYMTGDSIREKGNAQRWCSEYPEDTRCIMRTLSDLVVAYLSEQINNGADVIQVFESLGGGISGQIMLEFALPELARIGATLKEKYPNVPLMVFARGANYVNPTLQRAGFDVVTLDSDTDISEMLGALKETEWIRGKRSCIQGNFDPKLLIEGSMEGITEAVERMLEATGTQDLIANLGSGLMGKEDPELVAHYVNEVRRLGRQAQN